MTGEQHIHGIMSAAELFGLLRGDLQGFRSEINGRLDRLVGTELFAAEQLRVDGRLADMGADIVETNKAVAQLAAALSSETQARLAAEKEARDTESRRQADLTAQQSRNRWTVFGLVAGPVVTALITFALAGGFRVVA